LSRPRRHWSRHAKGNVHDISNTLGGIHRQLAGLFTEKRLAAK
jgi:hypothetical protein